MEEASIDNHPVASSSKVVSTHSGTSGLAVNLISEHHTRSSLQYGSERIVIGALLGTQSGREVSIVNAFELVAKRGGGGESSDVPMDGTSGNPTAESEGDITVDMDFLERRKEQFKQVFPTLDVIGWYTVGNEPTVTHSKLQAQFLSAVESPLLLLLSPDQANAASTSLNLPLKIYESALGSDAPGESTEGDAVGKLVELAYNINTGEAERIAVEGAAKPSDDAHDSGLVASLTTQRNAVQMLHDRMNIVLQYVSAVINKEAHVDDALLRDIAAVVSTLPTMQTQEFQDEFQTEHNDVQLTAYLSSLTKSLAELNDLTDKFKTVTARGDDENGGMRSRQAPGIRRGSFVRPGGR